MADLIHWTIRKRPTVGTVGLFYPDPELLPSKLPHMPTPLSRKITLLKDHVMASKVHSAEEFESFVTHMYLDLVGQVTIGIGHGILSAAAAGLIPFKKADGSRASANEIAAEFAKLHGMAAGQRDAPKAASSFEGITALRIDEETIYDLAADDIRAKEKDIKRHFTDYDSYPQSVKEALLDMVFSMGMGKLLRSYPSFCAAVRKHDWKAAADQSNRKQVQTKRNIAVKEKLSSAGGKATLEDLAEARRR